MSDFDCIPALIGIASNSTKLQAVQQAAALKLLNFDGEIYPADGCAITLSLLLQDAGIDVPDTYTAFELGNILLNDRGWQTITVGQQEAGDVGSTCVAQPVHGNDHIYLVLKLVNSDEMVIADNQENQPHFRFASGQGGKTPTKFFLRARA